MPRARIARPFQDQALHTRLDRLQERGLFDLVRKIARKHHVPIEEVLGSRRHRSVVAARHEAWNEMHARGMSWPQIAEVWGAKRADCVIHARKKTPMDPAVRKVVKWLAAMIDRVKNEQAASLRPYNMATTQIATLEVVRDGIVKGEWR